MKRKSIFMFLDPDRMRNVLLESTPTEFIKCEPKTPVDEDNQFDADGNDVVCCCGCDRHYSHEDVMFVDPVGQVCMNCLYVIASHALNWDAEAWNFDQQ